MKRIEFIAPVEAMRGNLSGNQELQYKTADGKVYSAAEYERLMAEYKTRYVGAKRRQFGNRVLNIFSVKTKSTSAVTAKSKKSMAVFGGAAEVYRVAFKNLSILSNLQLAYRAWLEAGNEGSMRKWAFPIISAALDAKDAVITLAAGEVSVRINNPWVSGGTGTSLTISQDILVKFWTELAVNGISFSVAGKKGIAVTGETFDTIINSQGTANVIPLYVDEIDEVNYVKDDGTRQFLLNGNEYVKAIDAVIAGKEYALTAVEPGA